MINHENGPTCCGVGGTGFTGALRQVYERNIVLKNCRNLLGADFSSCDRVPQKRGRSVLKR